MSLNMLPDVLLHSPLQLFTIDSSISLANMISIERVEVVFELPLYASIVVVVLAFDLALVAMIEISSFVGKFDLQGEVFEVCGFGLNS